LSKIVEIDLHGTVDEWNGSKKDGIGKYGFVKTGNQKIIIYQVTSRE